MTLGRTIAPSPDTDAGKILVLSLGDIRIAFRLASVVHVIQAVATIPVADAPAELLGLLDLHGSVVPLLDLRAVFGLPQTPVAPAQHFVLARACGKTIAIVVDQAVGVAEEPSDRTAGPADILPGLAGLIDGVVQQEDGLVLIYDLERFLRRNGTFLLDSVPTGE